MKHPVTKLFLARLRALAAAQRAAYPVTALPALITPFARHAIRIERSGQDEFIIVDAGLTVATLFGRPLAGTAAAELFEEGDRARVEAMLSAALSDRIGCVFGAEARHSRFRVTALEAMLTPEPIEAAQPKRACVCMISFGYPRRFGQQTLPKLALTGERYVDLDGFAGGQIARPSRRFFQRG